MNIQITKKSKILNFLGIVAKTKNIKFGFEETNNSNIKQIFITDDISDNTLSKIKDKEIHKLPFSSDDLCKAIGMSEKVIKVFCIMDKNMQDKILNILETTED